MKKVLLLAAFGVAGLMSAKNTRSVEMKKQSLKKNILWSYLYESTCGTTFTVSINKPIGDLNAAEQEAYNENLEAQNAAACSGPKKAVISFV